LIDVLPSLRSLPHSEESERAVLGCLLLDPLTMKQVEGLLRPDDFYLPRHQVLFRAMLDLEAQGTVPDLRTIQAHLEKRGEFEQVGGISYMATLDLDLPDMGRLDAYVAIVREYAVRRAVIHQSGEMMRGALGSEDISAVIGRAHAAVLSLHEQAAPSTYVSLGDLAETTVDNMERRWEGGPAGAVATPWPKLNEILDHIEPSEFVLVCGPPGGGKTSFMVQMMESICFGQGKSAGVVSLEMKATELTERLLSRRTKVPFSAIRSYNRVLSAGQSSQLVRELRAWKREDRSIEIDDSPFQTAENIASRGRRLHRCKRGIDALLLDYAGLIRLENTRNRDLELMNSVGQVKGLLKELRIPGVVFSQVTQEGVKEAVHGRKTKVLAQTAGGTALVQAAYVIIYLEREVDEDGEFQEFGRFVVSKHRGGPTGKVDTRFNGPTMSWEERD
jgi:replicative DNA helicase